MDAQYIIPGLCLAIILIAGYCVYAVSQALDNAPKIRQRTYDITESIRYRRRK